MKITFIIPFTVITGGIRVIYEYANRLQERGHEVSIVYPLIPLKTDLSIRSVAFCLYTLAKNIQRGNKVDWFDIEAGLVRIPLLSEKYIPDADIVVATSWPTADIVSNLSKNKGTKFYFIQHYETWSGPVEKVDNTYRLPLNKIVVASWLKDLMKEKFNSNAEVILNGVNLSKFYNDEKKYNKNKRVLMLYSSWEWKGIKDGIRAFEMAKEKHPEIQLVMFGTHKGRDIPEYVEFHKNISDEELRRLYCSCDIFISPSWTEGFHLPPMEAMACKCAAVVTNVGGVPDYTVHGETALVSPPKDPESLGKNIVRLLDDEEELKRISIAGYNYIKKFTWEKSVEKMESIFEGALKDS